jgi:Apea-like HEPN
MSSSPASESFYKLDQRLRSLIERQSEAGELRALPLSPVQIAREAQQSPEYKSLIEELFTPPGVADLMCDFLADLDQDEVDPDSALASAEAEWDNRFDFYSAALSELLIRSGYYYAVLSGSVDVDSYYSAIKDRIPEKSRTLTKLYLLDGCEFPRDQFDIAAVQVVKMSRAELESLGPSPAVCKDFFPNEKIDARRLCNHWFLKIQEDELTGYEYDRWLSSGDAVLVELPGIGVQEIAAGYASASKLRPPAPRKYLDTLMILSLYQAAFFEITKIIVCEPGWRRVWFRSTTPRSARVAESYSVSMAKWSSFESHIDLCSRGLQNARASRDPRPLITSCRRYLQATFATGDIFPQWETKSMAIEHPRSPEALASQQHDRSDVVEDAVLHYVFALEALLTGDSRDAIAEKVAISAALLIGRTDDEAAAVRTFVKAAYNSRSRLVHGQELKQKEVVDVRKLRRICQRVLVVALSLYAGQPTLDFAELLAELPISQERRRMVAAAREQILPSLGDSSLFEH